MSEKISSSISRAVLSVIPTSLIALDSKDTIIFANTAASRLLSTPREHLEGGSLARFCDPHKIFSPVSQTITFTTSQGSIELSYVTKELLIDDEHIKILLLKTTQKNSNSIADIIIEFEDTKDSFLFVCNTLVSLSLAQHACVRSSTSTQCDILASSTDNRELFSQFPTIARTITLDGSTHTELVIIPHNHRGLSLRDLSTIDMFISLLHLRMDTSESASDASGSETALALALKAGDMGMCFFDTSRGEAYLSDRLATWCSIEPDSFPGTLNAWLATFREDDRTRISALLAELDKHKKFKTVVHIVTLEGEERIELTGRPLNEHSSSQWVAVAKPYRNEEEVQAAWQTRIAMEEAARIEAEAHLEDFENLLISTLLPTTSDVTIQHSRQDAGTWHIVRPIDPHTTIYALGAVTAASRTEAIIDATMCATMADVIATHCSDIELFVELVRDHARARDIETTIAGVLVANNNITASTYNGASVFRSGNSFTGDETIEATTAITLSTHAVASVDIIDVAADGRPWKIMTAVIEVLPSTQEIRDTSHMEIDLTLNKIDEEPESNGDGSTPNTTHPDNVAQFRSGSINPS